MTLAAGALVIAMALREVLTVALGALVYALLRRYAERDRAMQWSEPG